MQAESKKRWNEKASRFGGSFQVDGWTSARNFGQIGLVLYSMGLLFFETLIASGSSSRATDYYDKLEKVLPMSLIFFMCTDGASNMVKLGDLMLKEHFILPQLCAAHGFSLLNHYIGRVFENHLDLFSRVTGIVAFFNRSSQRMSALRKETDSDIGFVKACKTRFSYMTFVFLRVLRLRQAAQIALLKTSKPSSSEDAETDELSKYSKVSESLADAKLFSSVELFVRLTLPIVLIMREFDRGTPLTGFVFWGFFCAECQIRRLLDALVEKDKSLAEFRSNVLENFAWVWEKRHSPLHSFAYLTNPLFHHMITATTVEGEGVVSPYELAECFRKDVKLVLTTMVKKRYGKDIPTEDLLRHLTKVLNELDKYFSTPFDEIARLSARASLASDWWTGMFGSEFPNLAYYSSRVHTSPCVLSSLERFFSMMTNTQTKRRSSLDAEKAGIFTAAHYEMVSDQQSTDASKMQEGILRFVEKMQNILDSESIAEMAEDGMSDLDTWLQSMAEGDSSLIYSAAVESSEQGGANLSVDKDKRGTTESSSRSSTVEPSITPSISIVLAEMEAESNTPGFSSGRTSSSTAT